MTSGIYGYYDNLKDKIIYIGQSQNIEKRNHEHKRSSKYNEQQINKVLQKNPNRYDIYILKKCSIDILDYWEITLISLFQPIFNFTNGGLSTRGYKHTDETKQKISESLKGHSVSQKTKEKISRSCKNKNNGKNNPFYGKKHSDESKNKMKKYHLSRNTTGIYRVSRKKDKNVPKGFRWSYSYNDNDGIITQITAQTLLELKEKMKLKGLEWIILDKNLAKQSFNED